MKLQKEQIALQKQLLSTPTHVADVPAAILESAMGRLEKRIDDLAGLFEDIVRRVDDLEGLIKP